MFGRGGKPKTKTVSAVVPEDVEKWVKYRARVEGITPSHWLSDLLTYSMMTDSMTKGEVSNIVHDLLHIRDIVAHGGQFNFNPWTRFQKNHPEGWSEKEPTWSAEENK